jgi:hypothetical protein
VESRTAAQGRFGGTIRGENTYLMENKNKLLLFTFTLATFPVMYAAPLCTDYATISGGTSATSATMSDYVALGHSGCQLDDKIFYDFSYNYRFFDPFSRGVPDNVDPDVQAGNVTVTAVGNPLNPVFNFAGNWSATNGYQTDIDIGYRIFALDAGGGFGAPAAFPIIQATMTLTGGTSDLDPANQGNGSVTTADNVLDTVHGQDLVLVPSIFAAPGGTIFASVTDAKSFASGTQMVEVHKDVLLDSGGNGITNTNFASVSLISEGVFETPVPEPLSLVLYGSGLVALGLLGRSRARRLFAPGSVPKKNDSGVA